MDTFADYILCEHDLASKLEITYYLSKKTGIFFDKSVIFKTELARMFLDYMKIDVDSNIVLTAVILCNCKKIDNPQKIDKLKTYAKEGADYLSQLGFDKRFSKICEEVNRYSGSNPREKESDILELIDNFGGMLLDRPERTGFNPDEAIVLIQHRNLKDTYNRYLESFTDFVQMLEGIYMEKATQMKALKRLVKIHNETEEIKQFIEQIVYNYEPKIDELLKKNRKALADEMFNQNANRPLFSRETTEKIMQKINKGSLTQN